MKIRQLDSKPILNGFFNGLMYSAIFLAACGVISLFLIIFDLVNGTGGDQTGGLSLIIPFGIGPLVILAGAPWSFVGFRIHSSVFLIVMIAVGVLLNGGLVGALFGMYKWLRRR